jgi:hypothetical protein
LLSSSWLRFASARSNRLHARRSALRKGNIRAHMESLEGRALLSAAISATDINSERVSQNVTVTYTDPEGIDTSTLGSDDLQVSGPKSVTVQFLGQDSSSGDVVATYALIGPDGSWDVSDKGGYAITAPADAVKDLQGNSMDGPASAAFDVNIPPPPDVTPPAVNSINVSDVTAAGGANSTVSITYSDESGIDVGTIGKSDITVSRNSGGGDLSVSSFSTEVSNGGKTVVATYTFNAPGG